MDFANASCAEFVRVLASNAPVPGGGGASACAPVISQVLDACIASLNAE